MCPEGYRGQRNDERDDRRAGRLQDNSKGFTVVARHTERRPFFPGATWTFVALDPGEVLWDTGAHEGLVGEQQTPTPILTQHPLYLLNNELPPLHDHSLVHSHNHIHLPSARVLVAVSRVFFQLKFFCSFVSMSGNGDQSEWSTQSSYWRCRRCSEALHWNNRVSSGACG